MRQIHLESDVFAAVTVMDAKAPYYGTLWTLVSIYKFSRETNLYTVSWETLLNDQRILPFLIILLILVSLTPDYVFAIVGRNLMLVTLGSWSFKIGCIHDPSSKQQIKKSEWLQILCRADYYVSIAVFKKLENKKKMRKEDC